MKNRAGSIDTKSTLYLTLYQSKGHDFNCCSAELFLRLGVCILKKNFGPVTNNAKASWNWMFFPS